MSPFDTALAYDFDKRNETVALIPNWNALAPTPSAPADKENLPQEQDTARRPTPVILAKPNYTPVSMLPSDDEVITKKWEGVVDAINVDEDFFSARLVAMNSTSYMPTDFAEFPISTLSVSDKELLAVGAVFYWILGHRTRSYGSVENINRLVFRRMPVWMKSEIDAARVRGQQVEDAVRWD